MRYDRRRGRGDELLSCPLFGLSRTPGGGGPPPTRTDPEIPANRRTFETHGGAGAPGVRESRFSRTLGDGGPPPTRTDPEIPANRRTFETHGGAGAPGVRESPNTGQLNSRV